MYDSKRLVGALLFVGSVQCLLGIIIAESLYPDYSVSENYISDLGVGPTSVIFNSSVFVVGLLSVAGSYFFQRAFDSRVLAALFAITGVGAMGVGLFPETAGAIHGVASLIVFLFGGVSAIMSFRVLKPPLSYFSVLLGALSLVALGLFGAKVDLGLGIGGMERMIAYPVLLWAVSFSSFLMTSSTEVATATKS